MAFAFLRRQTRIDIPILSSQPLFSDDATLLLPQERVDSIYGNAAVWVEVAFIDNDRVMALFARHHVIY